MPTFIFATLLHFNKLKSSSTIQKIIAVFMLALFSLSITPKKLLHTWFANHEDEKCRLDYSNKNLVQLTTGGYHCPTESLVVESPFENSLTAIEILTPVIYIQQNRFSNKEYFSFSYSISSLRGPPVC